MTQNIELILTYFQYFSSIMNCKCNNCLEMMQDDVQYLYDKTYKDDCDECRESNIVNSIYCLCNNDGNNYTKVRLNYCQNCENNRIKNVGIFNKNYFLKNTLKARNVY
jgi:hypothetical protein